MESEGPAEQNFEQKKVQCVKGSYYIYLPKKWAQKYGIDKSRIVLLKELSDESLLIQTTQDSGQNKIEYTIELDFNKKDLKIEGDEHFDENEYYEYLFNLYLTAYIIGISRVRFVTNDRISVKTQNRINKMTRKFYGMVIVKENQKEIVIEDTTRSIDLHMMIKQIISKVGMLISNYIEIIQNYNELVENGELNEQIKELQMQDDMIDDHRYSIERFVHKILYYPTIGHEKNISTIECLHFSECARMLERIGDYLLKISRILLEEPIKEPEFVLKEFRDAQEIFFVIQDYFFRTDSQKFFHLICETTETTEKVKKIIEKQKRPDWKYLQNIRRIKNICTDISEIRINDIIAKETLLKK